MVHFFTFATIVVWAMFDLQFEALIESLSTVFVSQQMPIRTVAESVGWFRVACLGVVSATAVGTLTRIVAGFFRSGQPSGSRSIASMLAITTAVAFWLSVAVNHASLAWQGKRIQMAGQVQQLESLTASLRTDWPEQDGDLPGIGPFMAYPFGRPSTLVLLQSPRVSGKTLGGDRLYIAAIERQRDGAILLQLSASSPLSQQHDDWVEWHPPSNQITSQPESFVGGLGDPHQLEWFTYLGQGWHLVSYVPCIPSTPQGDCLRGKWLRPDIQAHRLRNQCIHPGG
jgi:hypothetical protein